MKLFQLADDERVYRTNAGWWIVVSDDGEDELSMPFKTQEEAEWWIVANSPAVGKSE